MAKQIVMDTTGDTRHEFDPTDTAAIAEASTRFSELDWCRLHRSCAPGCGRFGARSQLRSHC